MSPLSTTSKQGTQGGKAGRSAALLALAMVSAAAVAGCRGGVSEDPPFHLIGDMDWQAKRLPQQAAPVRDGKPIFADGRAARPLVEHTVARGRLHGDTAFDQGKTADGQHVIRMPVEQVLKAQGKESLADVLPRGQERFNIYCAPCHDQSGNGQGIVIQRSGGGFPPPTLLSASTVKEMPDGQIFDTISHGVRNMPGYAAQIPTADRWAIVAWVRVLSKSQGASIEDVPAAQRSGIAEPEAAQ